MGNPIMELLSRSNPVMNSISQMMGMARAARDPVAAMQSMAQTDPRMRQVMQVVQQHGGNARTAFYEMARQRGVDPEQVLKQLQRMSR